MLDNQYGITVGTVPDSGTRWSAAVINARVTHPDDVGLLGT